MSRIGKSRLRVFATAVIVIFAARVMLPSSAFAEAAADNPQPRVLGTLHFKPGQGLITIPVLWKEKPARFFLSTGSSVSDVDSSEFPELTPRRSSGNIGTNSGLIRRVYYNPPDIRVGPFMLSRCGPVLRLDLSTERATSEPQLIGILGISAFQEFVLQLDYDAGEARFFMPDGQLHPEWGASVSMSLDGNVPVISAKAENEECKFAIATCDQWSVSLPIELFDRVVKASRRPVASAKLDSVGGDRAGRLTRLTRLDIGDFHYRNLLVADYRDNIGALGWNFLRRHLVTLDFPAGRCYLKPGKHYDAPDETDMSGLIVHSRDTRFYAGAVVPARPADEAGIRVGDEIVSVDGKDATNFTLMDFAELFSSGDGRQISVGLKRGGEVINVKMILKRRL
jgi:hypothetical protein